MNEVDRSEEEVVLEELSAREGVSKVDQAGPLDNLQDQENKPQPGCDPSVSPGQPVPPGTGVLDTTGNRPGTRQEDDRVEHAEPQKEVSLTPQEGRFVLGPRVEVDAKVGSEDERLEEHEDPHVGLTRHMPGAFRGKERRRTLRGRHDAPTSAGKIVCQCFEG